MSSAPTPMSTRPQAAGAGKRFLLISPNLPHPPSYGANQRTFLLFQALRQLGHVDFLLMDDFPPAENEIQVLRAEYNYLGFVQRTFGKWAPQNWKIGVPKIDKPLQRLVYSVLGWRYSLFHNTSMRDTVAKWVAAGHYDAIVTRYLTTAYVAGAFDFQTLFVDLDDLESEVWKSRAADETRSTVARLYRKISSSFQRKERALVARCAGAWVTKLDDAHALRSNAVSVLRNIPFAAYPHGVEPLPPASEPIILGVGLYDWLPNQQGFDWFIRHVWPEIHRAKPDSELHLAGKLSDDRLKAEWSSTPGVRYLGRVEDLQAAYRRALFTIAPIFRGGGTNIKVIESLAYGRSCVVTPHAARGFETLAGLHVGRNVDEFVSECVALLSDIPATTRTAMSTAQEANTQFSFASFRQVIHDSISNPSR